MNNEKIKTTNEMICICCPLGCVLEVAKNADGFVITGNKCPRGKKYAVEELTAPKRTVTSTVAITGSTYPVISVKTATPVPKEAIFNIMQELDTIVVSAPVHVGDIIIHDVAQTNVAIVATAERLELINSDNISS